jgi:hypothetical protein
MSAESACGNQAYANVLTNNEKIVLFLTPMWASHWQDLREEFTLMKHFKKIAKVDTPFHMSQTLMRTFRTLQSSSACTLHCCQAIQA